jgi:cyclopropane fatty-acyl-phospholipid synthase-like methyltransferase
MYTALDHYATLFGMSTTPPTALPAWQHQYEQIKAALAHSGWISEGYVQDRGPGAGGPCYQWTRKVKGKTVSVALSREQYQWLKTAIANWRAVQQSLKQMQQLSRRVLFETVPGIKRRKRLPKKTLGIT